mmetsp:Transcript_20797/g.37894  ORF Transcript_20797/g.37894 Transcript_20797/m.37894 type:complete len:101 (-) Transcript_20797:79-381(-)
MCLGCLQSPNMLHAWRSALYDAHERTGSSEARIATLIHPCATRCTMLPYVADFNFGKTLRLSLFHVPAARRFVGVGLIRCPLLPGQGSVAACSALSRSVD